MNNIEKYREDYKKLEKSGMALQYGFIYDHRDNPRCKKVYEEFDDQTKELAKNNVFSVNYHAWYNESLRLIKQLMPERLEDFIGLYVGGNKRKSIDITNYTISDSLRGVEVTRGVDIVIEPVDAMELFLQQLYIVKSLKACFESSLFNIKELLQADIFDSELDGAKELYKNGFYRAAGALCGVILERHFAEVCVAHSIKIKNTTPGISEFNDRLKEENVVDNKTYLLIQRLGSIRNLCDHNKKQEPTREDIDDLINGTDKVIHEVL